jgi:hypothetical protein
MSDASARSTHVGLDDLWASLTGQGYALSNDTALGFPEKFRENFKQTYFNPQVLRHDDGDLPIDRERARDVIRYWWRNGQIDLREFQTIAITDRAGIQGRREHSRVRLLDDPQAEEFIRAFLCLVPPRRRRRTGTFGVNLFRTFTDVVTKPHRDEEELIILYIVDRQGEGAQTYLYLADDVTADGQILGDPVLRQQLDPGDIIIFDDAVFKHGATPLEGLPDGTSMRDVLVCTIDYRNTYLSLRARFRAQRDRIRSALAARTQSDAKKRLGPAS